LEVTHRGEPLREQVPVVFRHLLKHPAHDDFDVAARLVPDRRRQAPRVAQRARCIEPVVGAVRRGYRNAREPRRGVLGNHQRLLAPDRDEQELEWRSVVRPRTNCAARCWISGVTVSRSRSRPWYHWPTSAQLRNVVSDTLWCWPRERNVAWRPVVSIVRFARCQM